MKIKVIKVNYDFWGRTEQQILKDDYIDLKVIPITGDIVVIDEERYRVIQRDIHMRKNVDNQCIFLFVCKL
jgi:hypothetical protein